MKEVKETVSGEDSNWNQSKRKREPHRAGVGRGEGSMVGESTIEITTLFLSKI